MYTYLHAFVYVFISQTSAHGALVHIYIYISVVFKAVMAIVMVGGGDTEGSGCAGDRLGESQWARDEDGERERRRE